MVLVGIGIGQYWYWAVLALSGIGIGIYERILLMPLFSQDRSTILNTNKCLSFSSSIFLCELSRIVYPRTENGKHHTSFSH